MAGSSHSAEPRAAIQRMARSIYSEAILDAAEKLFLEAGYAESKMAEVAARAGVAVGTVYKHFPSKEAVLASLAVRKRELVFELIDACSQIEDPVERVRAIVQRGLRAAEEGGALFAVYVQLRSVVESRIKAVGGVDEEQTQARFQGAVGAAYVRGVALGRLRESIPAERFASALCACLNAEVLNWVQAGRPDSLAERGQALLELLLEGALVR